MKIPAHQTLAQWPAHLARDAVAAALAEDLGAAGDITSSAFIASDTQARARIVARKEGVIAGLALALEAFTQIDETLDCHATAKDSDGVAPGQTVVEISGAARSILSAERVALNFLSHLSGVATATAAFVKAVSGTQAKIVGTRKTTPGLRAFEKYAVRCGGGYNHRFGLYDAVMIKDNHIAAAGGIEAALTRARDQIGHTVKIEIEIDRLDQLAPALRGGADIIMLDNMSTDDMVRAVEQTGGAAILEASGNVTLETVRAIAQTGVDIISSGWITHSAPILDLGLDFD